MDSQRPRLPQVSSVPVALRQEGQAMQTPELLPHCQRCGNSGMQRSRPNGSLEYFYYLLGVHMAECPACGCRNLLYPPGVEHPEQDLNRRQDRRLTVALPASFRGEDGSGEGLIQDISASGCRLYTPAALAVGHVLHLQIALPAGLPPLLIAGAAVRWLQEARGGLQFLQLQGAERERLSLFLHALASSQPCRPSLALLEVRCGEGSPAEESLLEPPLPWP
ncbi:MAG: PilZ domain-containing protein [Candidatus Tectimicrobiota bacterium]